eukprot:TRINITY_DN14025_c0_g2_i1.p1 TRINITY_DN14025_c0_g2~~TRINITY_DN14025_c0_g2_i1.p1  ORF type:complete len:724 (+),score=109.18 TRINITY_DN14025_c0_g2_i1:35-2206(+)
MLQQSSKPSMLLSGGWLKLSFFCIWTLISLVNGASSIPSPYSTSSCPQPEDIAFMQLHRGSLVQNVTSKTDSLAQAAVGIEPVSANWDAIGTAVYFQNAKWGEGADAVDLRGYTYSTRATFGIIGAVSGAASGSMSVPDAIVAGSKSLVPLISMMNPFAGFVAGVFLSFFQPSSRKTYEGLRKLFEEFWEQIQSWVTQQLVLEEWNEAIAANYIISGQLEEQPWNIADPPEDMKEEERKQYDSDRYQFYADLTQNYRQNMPQVFSTECLDGDVPKPQPGDVCTGFQAKGALSFQLAFANGHVGAEIEFARLQPDDTRSWSVLMTAESWRVKYGALLRQSLSNWLKYNLLPKCYYVSCDDTDHYSGPHPIDPAAPGCTPDDMRPWAVIPNDSHRHDPYTGRSISEVQGCKPGCDIHDGPVSTMCWPKDLCKEACEGCAANQCDENDFNDYAQAWAKNLTKSYMPSLRSFQFTTNETEANGKLCSCPLGDPVLNACFNDRTYRGGDLGPSSAANAEECQRQCQDNSDCHYFTFLIGGSYAGCNLKTSNATTEGSSTDCTTGNTGGATSCASGPKQCAQTTTTATAVTSAFCLAECASDPECSAVQFTITEVSKDQQPATGTCQKATCFSLNEGVTSMDFQDVGNMYCEEYSGYATVDTTDVEVCKASCTGSCNAFAIGSNCVTYESCVLSVTTQDWGYTYHRRLVPKSPGAAGKDYCYTLDFALD